MTIYYLPFLGWLFLSYFSIFFRKKFFLTSAFIIVFMILFAGFRHSVDNDYDSYVFFFGLIDPFFSAASYANRSEEVYFEPGFYYLISFIKIFASDGYIFLCVAAISLVILSWVVFSVSPLPAVSFFIYFCDAYYLREFTQIRFGLAIVFALVSLRYLKMGNKSISCFYSLISISMHYICFFLLFIPLWLKFVTRRKAALVLCAFFMVFYLTGIFQYVIDMILAVASPDSRLQHFSAIESDSSPISIFYVISQFIIVSYVVYFSDDKDADFFYVSICVLGFVCLCLFSGFDILKRVYLFLSVSMIFAVPYLIKKRGWVIFIPLSFYYSAVLLSRIDILRPYQTWLFKS